MERLVLVQYSEGPDTFLVEQVPGLALVFISLETASWWVFLAVGEPRFNTLEEQSAQQLMRRYMLDSQRYSSSQEALGALALALNYERSYPQLGE